MIPLSIVVPVYNGEKYIAETIDSLLAQTLANIEIIVVNDGSTDDTLPVLQRYVDPRLRVITQKNAGTFAARIRGLQEARGNYVGYVDGDDTVKPTMFEELYKATNHEQVDIVSCGLQTHYGATHGTGWHAELPAKSEGDHPFIALLEGNLWGYCCNKIYRRTLFTPNLQEFIDTIDRPLVMAEDFLQNVLLFSEATSFVHISKPLYIYRIHTGSIMQRVDKASLTARLEGVFAICDLVDSFIITLSHKRDVEAFKQPLQHARWSFAQTALRCVHLMGPMKQWNSQEYKKVFDYFGAEFSARFERLKKQAGVKYRLTWWVKRHVPWLTLIVRRLQSR